MQKRLQRTIQRSVKISGTGLFTGAESTLHFLPAAANHGIAFQRTDVPASPPIPALIDYTVPRRRRTAIAHRGVVVEMTEHVMAALAGLQIDNCLVQLNAPEPPACDGSSLKFVDALLEAGIVEQQEPRQRLVVESEVRVGPDDGSCDIVARPLGQRTLAISYQLDYGPRCPIQPQVLTVEISPESFVNELAFARTFVLEEEVEAMRQQGYGRRATAKDLIVFGQHGVVDNSLRAPDECVRHKILDCLGDFALIGCDLHGFFNAYRSGHELNRDVVRLLKQSHAKNMGTSTDPRAA